MDVVKPLKREPAVEPRPRSSIQRLAKQLRRLLRLRRLYFMRAELRWVPNESQRLFFLTIVIGAVCGLAAVAFHVAIQLSERVLITSAMNARGHSWIGWTLATPVLGGLLCGALLKYVVPNARGSGIPQVKAVFANNNGRLRLRDAVGKFFIGTLHIGSGASLGREGPTVQICSGIASTMGRAVGVEPKSLRRLIPVGAAAGIAAAFNAPIAAVTFTVEEVLGNLDQAMLSGVIVAAAIAAVIERGLLGEVTGRQTFSMFQFRSLLVCLVIGLCAALVSLIFTRLLLSLRARFRRMSAVPEWSRPAIGGLVTGVLAVVALATMNARGVTGGGYATLVEALSGSLPLRVMVVLCGFKLLATAFSYSSGGAGGIFAPTLFIGAMLGGSLGDLAHRYLNASSDRLGAFALVGMGAVFAGVIRAPMTSVLIVVEMTGSYALILPLMIANMTAYAIARRVSPVPIYEAFLAQDGIQLHSHSRGDPFDATPIGTVVEFKESSLVISDDMQTPDIIERWREGKSQEVYPVVDAGQRLVGYIADDDLKLVASDAAMISLTAAPDLIRPAIFVQPQDTMKAALDAMVAHGTTEIPVADAEGRLLGLVDEAGFARAYLGMRKGTRAASDTCAHETRECA